MLGPFSIYELYLLGALILAGLGIPLYAKWVGPNPWYGFRTPRTLSDPKIWYAVNRVTGFWLVATGIAVGVIATIADSLGWDILQTAIINGVTYIIGLVIMTVQSLRCLKRL